MDLGLYSLECNKLSKIVLCGVCGFGMTSGSPFYNIHCRVSVLMENRHTFKHFTNADYIIGANGMFFSSKILYFSMIPIFSVCNR